MHDFKGDEMIKEYKIKLETDEAYTRDGEKSLVRAIKADRMADMLHQLVEVALNTKHWPSETKEDIAVKEFAETVRRDLLEDINDEGIPIN